MAAEVETEVGVLGTEAAVATRGIFNCNRVVSWFLNFLHCNLNSETEKDEHFSIKYNAKIL